MSFRQFGLVRDINYRLFKSSNPRAENCTAYLTEVMWLAGQWQRCLYL
nr:MAG TPA: hypothetical protein [Bacteriophage sp.]